ncbi:hypothetical protein K439DRAFT_1166540 [Ramaria rubella]|nr:hypothetical protein K439DRAFT_1166540 [Ramaria rubella]
MSTWKTLFGALAVAMVLYPLPGMSMTPSFDVSQKHFVKSGRPGLDSPTIQCPDGSNLQVVGQPSEPSGSETLLNETKSFSIAVSSPLVFFQSQGNFDTDSSITLQISDNSADPSVIAINVVISAQNQQALDRAQVCLLERGGGQGVGFITPSSNGTIPPGEKVTFTATVSFPKTGSTVNVNSLETNMGIWSHRIASLGNQVVFGSLSFNTNDAPIQSDSVSAVSASFITQNGVISGSYNISKALTLSTKTKTINASIRMENADGNNPTTLSLVTEDAAIQAPITLVSTSTSGSPAAFSVSATTDNGPLDISFPEAPISPFSHLTFNGKTTNKPSNVTLHATYEGSIMLTAINNKPSLTFNQNTPDPSGQGRKRMVNQQILANGSLSGEVQWGNDKGSGAVVVTVQNAGNAVQLL